MGPRSHSTSSRAMSAPDCRSDSRRGDLLLVHAKESYAVRLRCLDLAESPWAGGGIPTQLVPSEVRAVLGVPGSLLTPSTTQCP